MNYYIHLTNNAVQSSCPAYGKLKNGNIFPISDLESYARDKGKPANIPSFMEQIKATIRTCFDATADILNPFDRKYCYEMYGFDFMVDESYKVWLLECNSGPSLSESNEFLSSLIKRALGSYLVDEDDLFKITVDKLFPPPADFKQSPSPFKLLSYSDSENLWDWVVSYPKKKEKTLKHTK